MDSVALPMILALVIGYAFGSIPFGLLLTRMAGGGDVREIGSGNIGATNVLRTGKKSIAALTLILDVAKGAVPVLIARAYFPGAEGLAAAGAFFGHLYPVWLSFKGGKGVATYGGIIAGLTGWEGGLIYAAVWIGSLVITRISSVAGLLGAVAAPIIVFWDGQTSMVALLIACSLVVFWKHWENIERLIGGNEPRIGSKDK